MQELDGRGTRMRWVGEEESTRARGSSSAGGKGGAVLFASKIGRHRKRRFEVKAGQERWIVSSKKIVFVLASPMIQHYQLSYTLLLPSSCYQPTTH